MTEWSQFNFCQSIRMLIHSNAKDEKREQKLIRGSFPFFPSLSLALCKVRNQKKTKKCASNEMQSQMYSLGMNETRRATQQQSQCLGVSSSTGNKSVDWHTHSASAEAGAEALSHWSYCAAQTPTLGGNATSPSKLPGCRLNPNWQI